MAKKEFDIEKFAGSGDSPGELEALREEASDIRRRLEVLKKRAESGSSYSKDIDHILGRIAVVEKHLGIEIKQPEYVDA